MYEGQVAAIRQKFAGKVDGATAAAEGKKQSPEIQEPALPELIDKIGCGLSQLRFLFCGGGVYCADGSVLLLVSAIAVTLGEEWRLSATQRGLLVTIVCLGNMVGNWICGPYADKYGRRHLVLASYLFTFCFSICTSLAQSYRYLMVFNFLVGLGMGLGIPAWTALATEITPRYYRIVMQSTGQALFTVGEIFVGGLIMMDDPDMRDLHWRGLLQLSAIPGLVFFILAFVFLHQSPAFLALTGRSEEAKQVLRCMISDNAGAHNDDDMSVNFRRPAPSDPRATNQQSTGGSQLRLLFGRQLCSTTIVCMSTAVVTNTVYFGSLYAFAQVLPGLSTNSGSAAVQLIIGALWEIPGITLAMFVGMTLPRKRMMKIGLCLNGLSAFLFAVGTTTSLGLLNELCYHFGYYGLKCFVMLLFITMYQYTSEVFPTVLRSTGNSVVLGAGKFGGMISPLFFEYLSFATKSHAVFFYLMSITCFLNACIVDFAPFEPTQMVLKDNVDEEEEESKDS